MDEKSFSKNLDLALRTGKCEVGVKEVNDGIKGSKLVLLSSSIEKDLQDSMRSEALRLKVPITVLNISSSKLGRFCGRPFRVSALSIRSPGEASIEAIMEAVEVRRDRDE
jgi:large subunit ribosomal protein L30e